MNIGVFGGTFDPPHIGHLIIADHVRLQIGLDAVLFVPSAISPHKRERRLSDPRHRLEMLALAVRGNGQFVVSDLEVERGGVSYTIDTLRYLSREKPENSLSLLIGTDNLPDFPQWKEPEEILRMARLVAMERPGFPRESIPSDLRERVLFCAVPQIGVASRFIRERVQKGGSIRYLVPDPVERYIREHHLYEHRGGDS